MCVCVCGSQRAGTILHSHGVWYFWRASRGLCIISVFKTQRKCYIESLLLVHKRIEKLFVKLKGPPYSCLLTTCLSSGSRIPIKILKPSISFSRRVEGEGQCQLRCPFLPVRQQLDVRQKLYLCCSNAAPEPILVELEEDMGGIVP